MGARVTMLVYIFGGGFGVSIKWQFYLTQCATTKPLQTPCFTTLWSYTLLLMCRLWRKRKASLTELENQDLRLSTPSLARVKFPAFQLFFFFFSSLLHLLHCLRSRMVRASHSNTNKRLHPLIRLEDDCYLDMVEGGGGEWREGKIVLRVDQSRRTPALI